MRLLSRVLAGALVASLLVGNAHAAPRTLRFATVAPDGTEWAHETRDFAREVEEATHGELHIKWYYGSVAGDDKQTLAHIRAHELDGMAMGACGLISQALVVADIVGLFRNRDETTFILRRIRSIIDEEVRQEGFTALGVGSFGMAVLFTRTPVRSLADLQRGTYFYWDMHQVGPTQLRAMGLHIAAMPVVDASRAYETGKIDGFVMAPTAALAFQWSTQARYYSDLPVGLAPACLIISNASLDALPLDQQRALRTAGERVAKRFDQTGKVQDEQLLNGLFERQGLKRVPVDAAFRSEFFEAARVARSALDPVKVPPALFRQVLDLLADYRAEQRAEGEAR